MIYTLCNNTLSTENMSLFPVSAHSLLFSQLCHTCTHTDTCSTHMHTHDGADDGDRLQGVWTSLLPLLTEGGLSACLRRSFPRTLTSSYIVTCNVHVYLFVQVQLNWGLVHSPLSCYIYTSHLPIFSAVVCCWYTMHC